MTQISTAASSRRETARQTDGKFGYQHHTEADISLASGATGQEAVQHISVYQFGGNLESAWIRQQDSQYYLHAVTDQDHLAMIPKGYAAAHRHSPAQMQHYLDQRQHVIEQAMGDWYGSEVKRLSSADTSARYEVFQELDGPVDEEHTRRLIDEEFGLHDEHAFDDMNAHIAAALAQHDATKLPNPDVINESNQRQFADRVIETLHRDAQMTFDDEGVHDAKVHLAGDSDIRLRTVLHNVYAENAGDIEAYDEATGRNPAHEAYYASAGCAEDLESTVNDLNARVIGRRLQRSFVADMPKLDTTHGRLEIEDDGTMHVHPKVFDDFAAKREHRIAQGVRSTYDSLATAQN